MISHVVCQPLQIEIGTIIVDLLILSIVDSYFMIGLFTYTTLSSFLGFAFRGCCCLLGVGLLVSLLVVKLQNLQRR
jgi:hypothetical protein